MDSAHHTSPALTWSFTHIADESLVCPLDVSSAAACVVSRQLTGRTHFIMTAETRGGMWGGGKGCSGSSVVRNCLRHAALPCETSAPLAWQG